MPGIKTAADGENAGAQPQENPAEGLLHTSSGQTTSADGPIVASTATSDAAPASSPSSTTIGRTGRVTMLGLRGIPDVQGGVERHVEILGSELSRLGWQVTVIGRRQYLEKRSTATWNGIEVVPLWSPRKMALEAAIHTLLGVLYAAVHRPDILHIHAIGPSLMVPLARSLGLRVVVTHHGFDYERQKWG